MQRVGALKRVPDVALRTQLRGYKTPPSFGLQYGPGGRHSNSGITATVFGAYGFVGRYFMNELGKNHTHTVNRVVFNVHRGLYVILHAFLASCQTGNHPIRQDY